MPVGAEARSSVLIVALATVVALWPAPSHSAVQVTPPGGTIVVPRGSGLAVIDAATGAEQPVAVAPPVGVAGDAVWSPDGARVALSRFGRRPNERVGGSDILLVGRAGGQGVPAVEHDADGALLGAPAWAPNGAGLFYDELPPNGGPRDLRVAFVAPDGGGRHVVAEPGGWPSVSPDGRVLLYVRPSPTTGYLDELVALSLDGGGERVIVPSGRMVQIVSPRFSPDGGQIAFVGSVSTGEAGLPPAAFAARPALAPRAHGPPGDVWLVRTDGSDLWQRTAFEEDEPTLAWSPDGSWLALLAGGGLYLVNPEGRQPSYQLAPGSFGGIDWRW